MIGKCNLPRQKIAALGRLLIMRPSETTYVYLAKNYQSSWGLKVTSQIVLLLLHALSGVPFPSVIRICVRPPDNQEDKMWGYIWKYSQFIKNSLWQEDRCNKILMREVEIGLIAMLFKFTWMHQPHRSQNMSNPPPPLPSFSGDSYIFSWDCTICCLCWLWSDAVSTAPHSEKWIMKWTQWLWGQRRWEELMSGLN